MVEGRLIYIADLKRSSGPRNNSTKCIKVANSHLVGLKVNIKFDTKVDGSVKLPSGKTELSLSDGQKITTDLYIPTSGLIPNSSYIPSEFLNTNGFVVVDEFLRVKGAENAWAVGDVSATERPQYILTEKQSAHVAKNIVSALGGASPTPYKVDEKGMISRIVN
jgi:apoptosis-inducing factor 2